MINTSANKNKSVKWIKRFGIIISVIIAFLLGNEGIFWKSKEANVKDQQLELEILRESVILREKKMEAYNEIIKLNNEFLELDKVGKIDKYYKETFTNRFQMLRDNFYTFEIRLAKLENRGIANFIIPFTISDNVPPKLLKATVLDSVTLKTKF